LCFIFFLTFLLLHLLALSPTFDLMLKDLIIILLIAYLAYKLLNGFILPLFNITATTNSQMRQMQEQMKAQMEEMNRRMNTPPPQQQKKKVEREGDYIDYEEV